MVTVRMRTIISTIAASLSLLALALITSIELLYLSGLYEMILLILRILCA